MVNVWAPLVPVGRLEGCMQFSRGSHHLGLLPHAEPPKGDPWLRLSDEVSTLSIKLSTGWLLADKTIS